MAQCVRAKTEALLPSRFREGRRDLLPSQNGRGGERPPPPSLPFLGGASGAQAGGPRPRPGSRLGAAHLRTGGEEECTGTADTTPGCNYLVRGYSPSMHYFWRGDMPHFSSPSLFSGAPVGAGQWRSPDPAAGAPSTSAGQIGAPAGAGLRRSPDPRGWRAVDLGGAVAGRGGPPPRPARSCAPSISAGMAPLAGAGQRTPLQTGGQPGAARAAQVRRGVTAAISSPAALPHFHTTFDSAYNAILR